LGNNRNYRHIESALIHGGIYGDKQTGAVNTPVYQTATYAQEALGKAPDWEYSRTGNPTRAALEALIAELEGGVAGFAFASGMAATVAVLSLFSAGDRILISGNVYGGTYRVLDLVFRKFGFDFEVVLSGAPEDFEAAITDDVKAILIESPSNPLLSVTDIRALAAVAKRRGVLLIVDNTFMTPYLQRPIELGADIVLHSATKYLGGHSDLIAGLAVVNTPELAENLGFIQNSTGGIQQPFDSFLLIRSIRTLGVRMDRHVENAEKIAAHLNAHSAVRRLYYPGLPGTGDYEINRGQAKSGGAMISFELGENRDIRAFFAALKLITLAESLGGVESLICHPATMTHASVPADVRAKIGIGDALVRLSAGIENVDELIGDLDRALEAAAMPAAKGGN
jgi:cystathionine beta-lyase